MGPSPHPSGVAAALALCSPWRTVSEPQVPKEEGKPGPGAPSGRLLGVTLERQRWDGAWWCEVCELGPKGSREKEDRGGEHAGEEKEEAG